jgi:tetratricopeptide (TPR) repeat protein
MAHLGMILGRVYAEQGQYERAKKEYEQHLSIWKQFNNISGIAGGHFALARLALMQDENQLARRHAKQSLQVIRDSNYVWLAPIPIVCIVKIFANENNLDNAIELFGFIEQEGNIFARQFAVELQLRSELETLVAPERFAAAWERGQKRNLNDLVDDLLAKLEENET